MPRPPWRRRSPGRDASGRTPGSRDPPQRALSCTPCPPRPQGPFVLSSLLSALPSSPLKGAGPLYPVTAGGWAGAQVAGKLGSVAPLGLSVLDRHQIVPSPQVERSFPLRLGARHFRWCQTRQLCPTVRGPESEPLAAEYLPSPGLHCVSTSCKVSSTHFTVGDQGSEGGSHCPRPKPGPEPGSPSSPPPPTARTASMRPSGLHFGAGLQEALT